jgi:antitoxin FitA
MATLTIKNLPDEVYQALKRRAEKNRRSLNGEVVFSLEQLIQGQPAASRPTVADFRALRERYPLPPLSEDELERAIHEGRP